jgi:hypothetical protein
MVKDKNKDLLKLIHEHTHLKNEDGEDVPFFCFTHDIMDTIDLDMSEEEIAQIALDNGYKVYKVFPEETMVGGLILCAEGCPKEAIDKMYEEFYGEIPTIEEWPTKELTEEKEEDNLEKIDLEDYINESSKKYIRELKEKARSRGAEIEIYQPACPERSTSYWYEEPFANLKYKEYVVYIIVTGELSIDIYETDEKIRYPHELEENGIYTDEQLFEILDSNNGQIENNNWFDFAITKIKNGTEGDWYYASDIDYELPNDLEEALDIDFYIDTVIKDFDNKMKEMETEDDEDKLNEASKKDSRLAQAGVSGYNQPKRTPNHPTKSHIVVAKEGDEIKTIRFGEQGAETAGKPKKSESERMKAKRKSFKARHAKNIAKGKMSAAYWANKIKW